jgi:hypothetical protein
MSANLPPIVKLAERLLADVVTATSRFPRPFRYGLGDDLRQSGYRVVEQALMAWRDHGNQALWIERLDRSVSALKTRLQTACTVRAFRGGLGEFEKLIRMADDLGRQVGGWRKRQHPQRQNAGAPQARQQRPTTLSTRAAPARANR